MQIYAFIAGIAVGTVATFGFEMLNKGVDETHRAELLVRQTAERVTLRLIAENALLGSTVQSVEDRLRQLDLYGSTKSDNQRSLIIAGGGSVTIVAENGVVTRIQDDCDGYTGGDCI